MSETSARVTLDVYVPDTPDQLLDHSVVSVTHGSEPYQFWTLSGDTLEGFWCLPVRFVRFVTGIHPCRELGECRREGNQVKTLNILLAVCFLLA